MRIQTRLIGLCSIVSVELCFMLNTTDSSYWKRKKPNKMAAAEMRMLTRMRRPSAPLSLDVEAVVVVVVVVVLVVVASEPHVAE